MDRIIIDVREPKEFLQGHVRGAINIPPSEMMEGAKQLINISKNTEIILYCISGARSRACMPYLEKLGFTNLVNGINKDQVEAMLSRQKN